NYSCEPRCRRHHCRQYPVRRQPAPEFQLSVQRGPAVGMSPCPQRESPSLVSERKIVSVLTKVIVAKRRVPSEQEIFRLVHGDVHSVRNFHAGGKIVIAGHRDAARHFEAERFVPKRHLVHHVLEDVSTRIIPEESPIDKTLRIKFMGPSFTFELLPSYMVEIA